MKLSLKKILSEIWKKEPWELKALKKRKDYLQSLRDEEAELEKYVTRHPYDPRSKRAPPSIGPEPGSTSPFGGKRYPLALKKDIEDPEATKAAFKAAETWPGFEEQPTPSKSVVEPLDSTKMASPSQIAKMKQGQNVQDILKQLNLMNIFKKDLDE